jgi:hypothetical protein
MKTLLLLLLLITSLCGFSQSGISWTSPVNVATAINGSNHPRITLDRNGDPLVIWGRGTSKAALFSRWNGTSFTAPLMLNSMAMEVFTDSWAGPDIASHGDTVYAVFKETPEDTNHIFIVRSVDGGQNFGMPVRVDHTGDSSSRFPTVTTDDSGNPIIAFMKFDAGFTNARWAVSRSSDQGNTFTADRRVSGFTGGNACDCCPASVLSSGSNTVVLYRNDISNIREIWAGFSTDNGNTFTNGTEVDNTNWMVMACPASGPDAIVDGDSLYTVFMSSGGGSSRVYLSSTSVSGQQLASSSRLTGEYSGLSAQNYPRIANAGQEAVIAWKENANGKAGVCLKFTRSLSNGFPSAYDTIHSGNLSNVDVAMSPGAIHLVWEDDATGTVRYVKGTYTSSASANEKDLKKTAVNVFPNPARGSFTVSMKEISGCVLMDATGRKIELRGETADGGASYSIAGISSGLYLLILSDTRGNSYAHRLQVQAD